MGARCCTGDRQRLDAHGGDHERLSGGGAIKRPIFGVKIKKETKTKPKQPTETKAMRSACGRLTGGDPSADTRGCKAEPLQQRPLGCSVGKQSTPLSARETKEPRPPGGTDLPGGVQWVWTQCCRLGSEQKHLRRLQDAEAELGQVPPPSLLTAVVLQASNLSTWDPAPKRRLLQSTALAPGTQHLCATS